MITENMRKNVEIAHLLGWRLWASTDKLGAAMLRFPGESAPEGYTEDVTADVDRWWVVDYLELPDCYTSVDAP